MTETNQSQDFPGEGAFELGDSEIGPEVVSLCAGWFYVN